MMVNVYLILGRYGCFGRSSDHFEVLCSECAASLGLTEEEVEKSKGAELNAACEKCLVSSGSSVSIKEHTVTIVGSESDISPRMTDFR